jgi:hypothetical protein
MKVLQLLEGNKRPKITYRENGDGSWTARVETEGGVTAFSRKKRADLEKFINGRYFSKSTKYDD